MLWVDASYDGSWQNKGAHDIFTLVIIFLGFDWKSKHVIFSLFEVIKTIDMHWKKNLIDLLDAYGVKNKTITYVKNKVSNMNTMIRVLKSIMKCEVLGIEKKLSRNMFWACFLPSLPICHL